MVIDKSTAPIDYESCITKLSLNEAGLPMVDSEFEGITEGKEEDREQKLKTKWAALEALFSSEKRVCLTTEDLVQHFERRLESMVSKVMVGCMSRRICIDLHNKLYKLTPNGIRSNGSTASTSSSDQPSSVIGIWTTKT